LRKEATTKLTLFASSKGNWHTKEDASNSMKNALYCTCCGMSKGVKKNQACGLSIVKLHWPQGIS